VFGESFSPRTWYGGAASAGFGKVTLPAMKFDISGFTDVGTVRESNQDRILINGSVIADGAIDLEHQSSCTCFVADGVGGNKAGDFASDFVLQKIRRIDDFSNIEEALRTINAELIDFSAPRSDLSGTATTLTGLIASDDSFRVVHVGDSQMWLRRNGTFFKITNDQVLNEYETNSPLMSYFGGSDDDLRFDNDIFVSEISSSDVFMICSDGLLKSLNHKTIKAILDGDTPLRTLAQTLLKECREKGADDNVSVILIQRTE
jgi:serine/threonine protein phosphatase PrpC